MYFSVVFISALPLTGTHCPSSWPDIRAEKDWSGASVLTRRMSHTWPAWSFSRQREGSRSKMWRKGKLRGSYEEVKRSGGLEKTSDSQNDDDESSEVPISQITQVLQFFPLFSHFRHGLAKKMKKTITPYSTFHIFSLRVYLPTRCWPHFNMLSVGSELKLGGYLRVCVCVHVVVVRYFIHSAKSMRCQAEYFLTYATGPVWKNYLS